MLLNCHLAMLFLYFNSLVNAFLYDSHSNSETQFNRNYYPHFRNEEKKVQIKVIQLVHGSTLPETHSAGFKASCIIQSVLCPFKFQMFH